MSIEVLIITKDEEANLPHTLASLQGWTQRIWVVDSGSSDRTVEIARAAGCEVRVQEWQGYAKQKNWALDTLPLTADWVLIVDADEAVAPALRDALVSRSNRSSEANDPIGYYINRHFVFLGGVIWHSGYYPSWNIRFFRRGRARYEDRLVHEHLVVDGPVGYIAEDLIHFDRRPLEHHISKHNRYSTLEAQAIFAQEQAPGVKLEARLFGDGPARRRWFKRHIYPRLPCKFLLRFAYMYLLKCGFLDGLTGLRFALFITSYELHIELKLIELRMQSREACQRSSRERTPPVQGGSLD